MSNLKFLLPPTYVLWLSYERDGVYMENRVMILTRTVLHGLVQIEILSDIKPDISDEGSINVIFRDFVIHCYHQSLVGRRRKRLAGRVDAAYYSASAGEWIDPFYDVPFIVLLQYKHMDTSVTPTAGHVYRLLNLVISRQLYTSFLL